MLRYSHKNTVNFEHFPYRASVRIFRGIRKLSRYTSNNFGVMNIDRREIDGCRETGYLKFQPVTYAVT
jgi:hypothetical protein